MSPDGVELATLEVTFPRIVLAEFNTHRMLYGPEETAGTEFFSRNSASSRAIPVKRMIAAVTERPYLPQSWGKNQKPDWLGPPEMWFGNFRGWVQYRKTLQGEADILAEGSRSTVRP